MDKRLDGMWVDCEKSVEFLLHVDLVSKRHKTGNVPSVTISTTDGDNIKIGIRKSGDALRLHKWAAYVVLNKEQQDELR